MNRGRKKNKVFPCMMLFFVPCFFFASCFFFPTPAKYYQAAYRVDELGEFRFFFAEIDASGSIYFADEFDNTVWKWSESLGLERYLSYSQEVEALALDRAGSKLLVRAGNSLEEADLLDGSTDLIIDDEFLDGVRAIGIAGDFLVLETNWYAGPEFDSVRRSDGVTVDTITPDIYAKSYLYDSVDSKLFIIGGSDWESHDNDRLTVVDIDPATGTFGIPLERDLHDTPFNGWIPKMWRMFPDGSRLLTGEGTIYQTDDNLSYDSTITIEPFEDYDSPWIRDACFYADYLVTLENTYEKSGISFYQIDPPYDRVQPRVDFGVRGRRIFSDNEFIYMIAEQYEGNFSTEIYKIDSSILE